MAYHGRPVGPSFTLVEIEEVAAQGFRTRGSASLPDDVAITPRVRDARSIVWAKFPPAIRRGGSAKADCGRIFREEMRACVLELLGYSVT